MGSEPPPHSRRLNDALIKMAMIDEMARADNWQSLDECMEFKPKAIKEFSRYAEAALRAIRRIETDDDIAPLPLNVH